MHCACANPTTLVVEITKMWGTKRGHQEEQDVDEKKAEAKKEEKMKTSEGLDYSDFGFDDVKERSNNDNNNKDDVEDGNNN